MSNIKRSSIFNLKSKYHPSDNFEKFNSRTIGVIGNNNAIPIKIIK
ncbi:hypothetical protein SAMN02745154_00232 [Mycoplasmopsis verecunda]|uniref:Uncharacterized protein n=1 Tax=Mycoplasmopsis verecunda TaxID=171291 RepID=A0A1T4KXQ9_9BACT|nr:hypothetical protein SAMN02745154_00232 [Mycoplasmopsis verecunda]